MASGGPACEESSCGQVSQPLGCDRTDASYGLLLGRGRTDLVADPCAPDAGADGFHGTTQAEQVLAGQVADEVAANAVDMGRRHPGDLGVANVGQHQLDASTIPCTGLPAHPPSLLEASGSVGQPAAGLH